MRGNIFVKIFIGFWLVSLTVLGSWMLADRYFQSSPHPQGRPPADAAPQGPPPRFALRLIYGIQHSSDEELRKLIRTVSREHGVSVYLLERQEDRDILGREVPEAVARVAGELQGPRRRAFLREDGVQLLAHSVYRREQGMLRAILVIPPPRNVVGVLGRSPALRLGMAVLISGLVCFALSRVMTRRLKQLQQASRQLADGDLDTRLRVRDRGGDETDELARDFNTMAQHLQERIQAQKRLLADVSHELRSPLARLRVALALAQKGGDDSEDYLQRIEHEAERLEELIGQLLSTQSPGLQLDTHIDLVPLLRQLCADASFEGEPEGKRVRFDYRPEQAIVASSGDLLHKTFDNILRNALIHTRDHTEVTVILRQQDEHFTVSIEDEGPGVPEEELDRIFGEFYRVDTARTRESGGYGLGLAIARRAVAGHGGTVAARNTSRGLAVTVTLPAHS